jgi:hypothetical protein
MAVVTAVSASAWVRLVVAATQGHFRSVETRAYQLEEHASKAARRDATHHGARQAAPRRLAVFKPPCIWPSPWSAAT